jgi:hypothetical protein
MLVALSFRLFAQEDKSVIKWNENNKLCWSDFTFVNGDTIDSFEKATISPEIRLSIEQDSLIRVFVTVQFNSKKSWTSDTTSYALLAHEQLHFDIAEHYGRKIRQKCHALTKERVRKYTVYDKAFKDLYTEYSSFQNKYDLETAHGTRESKQIEWREKIDDELIKLEEYKSTY